MKQIVFLTIAGALVAAAQPVIETAENAAGYMKSGLPNGGLAQGSLIVIKGRGLSQRDYRNVSIPLPLELAGTTAQITVGGTTLTMPMNYVIGIPDNKTQISAVIPSATPVGSGSIRVTYNGQTSAAFPISVVKTAFGIFTINSAGSGSAIAYTGPNLNTPTEALRPGTVAQIFGTGLGPVSYSDREPAQGGDLNVDVEVWVGFKRATVSYKGRIPQIASVDQINFIVPADTPPGCAVSLVVRAGGVVSNATTVPVALAGKTCSDPLGYPADVLSKAGAGVNVGYIGLVKTAIQVSIPGAGTVDNKTDSLLASFQRMSYNQFLANPSESPSVGSCTTYTFTGQNAAAEVTVPPVGLDAGASIAVAGPSGSQTLDKVLNQKGFYSKSIIATGLPGGISIPGFSGGAEFLTPGRFTATGPGGVDVGAFSSSVTWPSAFSWSNQTSIASVPRAQDLTVTWSGAPPDGYVAISGFSIGGSITAPVGAGFTCLEKATAGRFAIPSVVLQILPTTTTLAAGVQAGLLSVAAVGLPVQFTATGLDYGYMNFNSVVAKLVNYQ
ncbi:MAG: hypothetical protein NTV70_20545 [Acidobacteria bacterium]|nr:hypothetical protein [Acidobacteriota bacterium]